MQDQLQVERLQHTYVEALHAYVSIHHPHVSLPFVPFSSSPQAHSLTHYFPFKDPSPYILQTILYLSHNSPTLALSLGRDKSYTCSAPSPRTG